MAHVQNAEDIHKYNTNWRRVAPNWDYIRSYFDKCRVFHSREVAFGYAMRLEEEFGFVEYGICDEEIDEVYQAEPKLVCICNADGSIEIPLDECYVDRTDVDTAGGVKLTDLLRDDWRDILDMEKNNES